MIAEKHIRESRLLDLAKAFLLSPRGVTLHTSPLHNADLVADINGMQVLIEVKSTSSVGRFGDAIKQLRSYAKSLGNPAMVIYIDDGIRPSGQFAILITEASQIIQDLTPQNFEKSLRSIKQHAVSRGVIGVPPVHGVRSYSVAGASIRAHDNPLKAAGAVAASKSGSRTSSRAGVSSAKGVRAVAASKSGSRTSSRGKGAPLKNSSSRAATKGIAKRASGTRSKTQKRGKP